MIPRLKPAVLLPCFGLIFLGPVGVSSQDVNTDNKIILSSVPFSVDLKGKQDDHVLYVIKDALNQTLSSGTIDPSQNQTVELTISKQDQLPLTIQMNENSILFQNPFVPGWASLAPPLIAISLALLFHEVITALLAGVWLGAFMIAGYNPFSALGRSIDSYVV
ncbi:MAG: hypothetical protein ABGX31_06295, partial [bacterium]